MAPNKKKRIANGYEIEPVPGVVGLSEMTHLTSGRLRWTLAVYKDCKRVERRVVASNRTMAKKVAGTMREEMVSRPASAVVVDPRMTMAALYAEWIEQQKAAVQAGERSSRTVTLTEQRWMTYIEPTLGKVRLGNLSKAHVTKIIQEAKKAGKSPSLQDSLFDIVSGLCRFGIETDRMMTNPARALAKAQRPSGKAQKTQRVLTECEVASLIGAASNGWGTLFRLLAESGLRISEALGLTWANVSFEDNVILVERQLDRDGGGLVSLKTPKSRRTIPMTVALRKALAEKKMASRYSSGSDLVFVTSTGRSPGYHNARRAFAATVKKAGIICKTNERVGLHALRHHFGSVLLLKGVNIEVVSRLMGHSSVTVTLNTYSHVMELLAARGEVAAQVEAAFGGKAVTA